MVFAANKNLEKGFTVFELLMVMLIILIISGIGVRGYFSYRKSTYDTLALKSLQDAIRAQEAYYTKSESYLDCVGSECLNNFPELRVSDSIHLGFRIQEDVGENSIVGVSCSTKGTADGKQYFRVLQMGDGQQISQLVLEQECSDAAIEEVLDLSTGA